MPQFFEPISEQDLVSEINRICGTTNEVYTNKQKVARVNDALDRYWFLASNAAPKGMFDDTSNTSAPIETKELTSGTNEYKVSDFTNEILQILKVSVLQDDGTTETDLIHEEFDDYSEFLQWYDTNATGVPSYWTKIGDFLYLRPTPNYTESNGLRVYANRELSKYTWNTFTITEANPGVITDVAHGLSNGDAIVLITDGALPSNLTADTTVYYVSGKAADTFKLATTPSNVGSTEVDTSGGGSSGTHKYAKVSKIPGIPVIHHKYLSRHASVEFMSVNNKQGEYTEALNVQAPLLLQDERAIEDYWQNRERELSTVIRPRRRAFR